jgi:two-component system, OmpR family, sensor histidine kinase SaeS
VIGLALVVAVVTAAAAAAVMLLLQALPTVRLQVAGLAFFSVVLPLSAVLLSGWVMFHMGDDVKILAVSSAAATAAVAAGLLLGRTLGGRLDRIRHAARDFARGDLTARTPEDGPAELAELSVAFNDMASRLAELFDTRKELVAWASHDLRTPIGSLRAMLEALEDGVAEPAELLPVLRRQVRTLERLVDDLFEVACIDAGALTLELRPTDVSQLVQASITGLAADAEARGVRLEARTNGASRALCAPEKIERVLGNLVTNALRHTPPNGSVVVSVEELSDVVQVTVDDTGVGVAPDARRRMFDRFWRGDDARTPGDGGAGLGLTVAQGLVEAHGGRIWVEPRSGGGTRVAFTLPAARESSGDVRAGSGDTGARAAAVASD